MNAVNFIFIIVWKNCITMDVIGYFTNIKNDCVTRKKEKLSASYDVNNSINWTECNFNILNEFEKQLKKSNIKVHYFDRFQIIVICDSLCVPYEAHAFHENLKFYKFWQRTYTIFHLYYLNYCFSTHRLLQKKMQIWYIILTYPKLITNVLLFSWKMENTFFFLMQEGDSP